MPQPNERLIQLLEYIEQVEKLKKRAVFVVPDEFFRAFQQLLTDFWTDVDEVLR